MNTPSHQAVPTAPILVVEDDAAAAEIFGLSLRAAGYRVGLAGDAEAALSFVEGSVPAAMIVDLRLPGMDGLEFLRRTRTRGTLAAVPAAVVTGDYLVNEEVVDALNELGVRLFFKPIWDEDFRQIVSDLLSGSPPDATGP